jgi:hypothetical protein
MKQCDKCKSFIGIKKINFNKNGSDIQTCSVDAALAWVAPGIIFWRSKFWEAIVGIKFSCQRFWEAIVGIKFSCQRFWEAIIGIKFSCPKFWEAIIHVIIPRPDFWGQKLIFGEGFQRFGSLMVVLLLVCHAAAGCILYPRVATL